MWRYMGKLFHKTIIIGGMRFSGPNACAQRSLGLAKLFSTVSDNVLLVGLDKEECAGTFYNFPYQSFQYPNSLLRWFAHAFSAKRIIHLLKKQSLFDGRKNLVVVNGSVPSIPTAKIVRFCRKHGILFVLDIDEWYSKSTASIPRRWIKNFDTNYRMDRLCHRYEDYIVASSFLRSHCGEEKNIFPYPALILNRVPFEQPKRSYPNLAIRLCFVGMIEKDGAKENLDEILKALDTINAEPGIPFCLDVVGDGGTDTHFVKYHGVLKYPDAISYLATSDFSLIPRKNTRKNNAGFPTKLSESFLYGVPCISTRTSDIADYIIDGENGFLVPADSEEEYLIVFRRIRESCSSNPNYLKTMKEHTVANNRLRLSFFEDAFSIFVERLVK